MRNNRVRKKMTAGKIIQHIFLTQHKNTLFFVKQFPLDNAIHKKKKKQETTLIVLFFLSRNLNPSYFFQLKQNQTIYYRTIFPTNKKCNWYLFLNAKNATVNTRGTRTSNRTRHCYTSKNSQIGVIRWFVGRNMGARVIRKSCVQIPLLT